MFHPIQIEWNDDNKKLSHLEYSHAEIRPLNFMDLINALSRNIPIVLLHDITRVEHQKYLPIVILLVIIKIVKKVHKNYCIFYNVKSHFYLYLLNKLLTIYYISYYCFYVCLRIYWIFKFLYRYVYLFISTMNVKTFQILIYS